MKDPFWLSREQRRAPPARGARARPAPSRVARRRHRRPGYPGGGRRSKRLARDFGAPYRGVLDVLERDRRHQRDFRQLTSSAWALSISEAARSIVSERRVARRPASPLERPAILGLLLAIAALHPDQSPEEKAAFAALNQVEALQQETRRYHEAEARADEAYVADLPRAELSRDATFRREPRRAGAVVLKAPDGMVLAIERRQGRWRLVMYRDPLTGQLARAWVYANAVSPLAPPVDADAR